MGSTRLPGKSMMPLAGEPLVGRILERVKRIATVDEIVLAVPETSDNDPLAALVQRYGVSLVRGSENDLVDRYYQAARAVKAEIVLRLPADNPCPEPAEIERILAFHRQRLSRRDWGGGVRLRQSGGGLARHVGRSPTRTRPSQFLRLRPTKAGTAETLYRRHCRLSGGVSPSGSGSRRQHARTIRLYERALRLSLSAQSAVPHNRYCRVA